MAQVGNPHRRKAKVCEVCCVNYIPTYSKQRSCTRACGVVLKGQVTGGAQKLSDRYLNAPMTRERLWLKQQQRIRASAHMLARYHADPDNWTTRKKRRILFDRDGWQCRVCGKPVTDTVKHGSPNRAVAGHIVARATGGQWTDDNMATLCHPCNVRDGVNRIPIQTALSF